MVGKTTNKKTKKVAKKTTAKKTVKAKKKTTKKAVKKTVAKKTTKKAVKAKKKTTKQAKISKTTVKKATTTRKAKVTKPTNVVAKTVIKSGDSKLEIYKLKKDIPENKYFILANGKQVKHVAHLAEIMDELEDHVFNHHVNPERNDFHNWVKDVFKDLELAKKMLNVSNKKDLQLVIYKHVAHKVFD